jgi:IS1 family transposase
VLKKSGKTPRRRKAQGNACQDNKIWVSTAVDHFKKGILGWVIGDHSSETFRLLWELVKSWGCYFYVSDGWSVYSCFIAEEDHIVSKTYMTRVEGENTRLRYHTIFKSNSRLS